MAAVVILFTDGETKRRRWRESKRRFERVWERGQKEREEEEEEKRENLVRKVM